ncbi:MAG: DsrE family protein [Deltaproteobacteria bacterium]|nr:DsrE family protein [Deltaproteobacteria bacterium]
MHTRTTSRRIVLLALALLVSFATTGLAQQKHRKVAIQVSTNDPKVMNQALNVANNLINFYKIDNISLEIVTFGMGLDMVIKDSPLQKRVESLFAYGNVKFAVCANTMKGRKIEKDGLLANEFIQNAIVPAGVVRLLELQDEGYTVVQP